MWKKLLILATSLYAALCFAAVDANKASQDELTQIKGIGPAIAERIVDARKQGNFKSWDDLIERVKGVASTSASKFSEAGLTVNGQSMKGAAPAGKATSTGSKTTQVAKDVDKKTKPIEKTGKN